MEAVVLEEEAAAAAAAAVDRRLGSTAIEEGMLVSFYSATKNIHTIVF